MSVELILSILTAAIQYGAPILYATLGEIIMERAGVMNLGLEGIMMVSAFAAFVGMLYSGNPWVGLAAGALAGMLLSLLHGFVCLTMQGNQVVSGLAITILGSGLANYLGTPFIGSTTAGFPALDFPLLSAIPVLGPVFFQQNILVYILYTMPFLVWFMLMRTRFGLALRVAGEYPAASRSAGISPKIKRWQSIVLGGLMAGMGGAYLSLVSIHSWTPNISAGRGWIAVALVIFAFWRPGRAVVGALLFGGIMAFQFRLQGLGTAIPSSFLSMLPYVLTLFVLFTAAGRGKGRLAPKSLGVNLEPED